MNQKLWKEAYQKLSVYGENPPTLCWSRLAAEEAALQGTDTVQGFAVLGKIKEKALAHHTVTFAGGTIGSSFAAWLLGATDVNPLPPHYRCPKCGKTEFVHTVADGFDLPQKKGTCGEELVRDGHNIPFEGYAKTERQLGTHIELRVSGKFKPVAIKTLLDFYKGVAQVLPVKIHSNGDAWLMERYVVLPEHKTKPSLSADGFWHVASEEYWQWRENETTFTLLEHEPLNEIERLQEVTGVNSPNPLAYLTPQKAEALCQNRWEKLSFITHQLTEEICNFDLLTRIDLLSHATGAWEGNGELLVQEGSADFRELPAAREDIFNAISAALAQKGIRDNGFALQVMEKVRKGLFYSRGMEPEIESMLYALGLPDWYPAYLKKVMYLFPKAHCIDYLLVDIVLQWYRENYPAAKEK